MKPTQEEVEKQAKLDRAKLASPMLEFDQPEAGLPDGHLYNEAFGENLED